MMDLVDSIRIFQRLADRKSFSGVAKELGVAQPTVSKAIAALERRLGIYLFRRSPRGISLTNEGEKLLHVGGPAIDHLETALAEVRDEKLALRGQLRITSSLAFARVVLVPKLEAFARLHPDLRLDFTLSDRNLDLVEEGLDLAIRHGEQRDSSLTALKVGSWRRAVFASPSYLKKHGTPATLDELSSHRLVYYSHDGERPTWTFNNPDGTERKVHVEPYLAADGSDLIREAVLRGTGLSLLPTWMMTREMARGTVVRMFDEHCTEVVPIYLMRAGGRALTAKQQAMANFLRATFDGCACLTLQRPTVDAPSKGRRLSRVAHND